jgi:hypothetical protein
VAVLAGTSISRNMDLVTAGCFSLICVFCAYAVPSSVRRSHQTSSLARDSPSLYKRRIQEEARRTKAEESRDERWITHARQHRPWHRPGQEGEKMHCLNLDHHVLPYSANAFMYLCAIFCRTRR